MNFETNLATLTKQSKPVLDEVAKGLKEHHRLKVELQGHTDSTGSAAYNLGLSQRRADSVRDYLVSQGVSEGQLTTKGSGETQAVASNATQAGRLQNRRVLMRVLQNPGDIPVKDAGKAQEGQQRRRLLIIESVKGPRPRYGRGPVLQRPAKSTAVSAATPAAPAAFRPARAASPWASRSRSLQAAARA